MGFPTARRRACRGRFDFSQSLWLQIGMLLERIPRLVPRDGATKHSAAAEEHNDKARWNEIGESSSGRSAFVDILAGHRQQLALIPGASLAVWLLDPMKQTLYAGAGSGARSDVEVS